MRIIRWIFLVLMELGGITIAMRFRGWDFFWFWVGVGIWSVIFNGFNQERKEIQNWIRDI